MLYDYRLRFRVSDWPKARAALALVGGVIQNMLGDPLDRRGNVCAPDDAVARGRTSSGWIYLHIRSERSPDKVSVDFSAHGMELVTEDDSAAVLGVWA